VKQKLLNLAAVPFVNERPVRRTAILLWILGLALLVVNAMLYQRHISGQHQRSNEIESIEASRQEALATIENLEEELSGLDLSKQNRQVEFLNSQIDKRTFSWSRLIDRLAEVLPNTVQLRRVTPVVNDPKDPRRARAGFEGQRTVTVELVGVTSSNESILEFVDALFDHPSFVSPDLSSEARRQEGMDQFALNVIYLPDRNLEEQP